MFPTHMILPSGVKDSEMFLEQAFIIKEFLSFFSPFEEEEVVEAEDACMLPGGKSKLSEELESAWVDFKSMLQLMHWKSQVSICFFCAFSLAIFSTS